MKGELVSRGSHYSFHHKIFLFVVVVVLFLWLGLVLGFLLDLVLFVGEVAKAGGCEGTGGKGEAE